MSYIYIISTAKHEDGPVKIGISDNPDKRLKQIQTGYPEKIEIKHLEEFKTRKKTFELERLLHKDFSIYRSHGEWFNMTVKEAINYLTFTIIQYGDSEIEDNIDLTVPYPPKDS